MRKNKRSKPGGVDLDITSLLDIIVTLIVFLITTYNTSGIIINIPTDVKIPISTTQDINTEGVQVQVSQDRILVEDEFISETKASSTIPIFDQDGRRIIPLFNKLVEKKEMIKQLQLTDPKAKTFSGRINFILDKNIKYSLLKKLMYTAAEAGFVEYKFIVLSAY